MTSPGPVLAAVDFSPHARHAADRAALLARETAAPLALLHVLPRDTLDSLRAWLGASTDHEARFRGEALGQLAQLAGELQAARHVEAAVQVSCGAPVDEILQEVERRDARLLVLGARGAGFLRRLLLGTTAERLLRRTARPLLVVRQTPHERYRRALVAVDFSPWAAQALALARRLAPHGQIVLLHAFEVPFGEKLRFAGVEASTIEAYRQKARADATQSVHRLADAAGLKPGQWHPCIVEGDPSLRIVEQELLLDADLVVLGKHGRAAGVDLLLGSVTQHVLAEGCADVAVSTAHDR